jgi:hypothetical protein
VSSSQLFPFAYLPTIIASLLVCSHKKKSMFHADDEDELQALIERLVTLEGDRVVDLVQLEALSTQVAALNVIISNPTYLLFAIGAASAFCLAVSRLFLKSACQEINIGWGCCHIIRNVELRAELELAQRPPQPDTSHV